MNDTVYFYDTDTLNNVVDVDSSDYTLCIEDYESYSDFKFITETLSSPYEGPIEREVTFISAGWNFVILFVVMILTVMNKFFAPQRFASIITMPFQGGGDKLIRENQSFFNVISLSSVISFILLISMMIQKFYLVFGKNYILHDNLDFFWNISVAVTLFYLIGYLLTLFYSWLYMSESILILYSTILISTMASGGLLLIPIIMVLLFYPYKFVFIVASVVMFILFAIRFIKLLIEVRMFSKLNFVNIFLYLCTTEILPVLVIFKMIMNII